MTQQTFKIFIFVRQPERYIDNRITISRDSKEIGLTQKLTVPFVSSIGFSDEESGRKKKANKREDGENEKFIKSYVSSQTFFSSSNLFSR